MISTQTKQSINFIFAKAAKATLALASSDSCHVEVLPEKSEGELAGKHVLVFTISSFLFRVVVMFHIDSEESTRNYFLKGNIGKTFTEIFSEAGNLCVGKINHELLRYFPHLGMSTPYILDGSCVSFLSKLKPGYHSHHRITINSSIRLNATVYMCGYAPINFTADRTIVEESTGELELF